MEEKSVNLQFNLNVNNFRLLEEDKDCSIAEVDFLHLGVNRNSCNIDKECVEKSLQSFYNKPLLCILDNSFIPSLSTDFVEHARTEEDRKKFIALGTIPESTSFKFETAENGKTYLSANVVIWKKYFPVIMDILEKREGNVKISIEIAVIDGDQDEDTGILNIHEFKFLSCVLLGEDIVEGIEGSHLEIIRFSLDENCYEKANEYYAQFSKRNKEVKVPEKVINSILKGLKAYKEIGKGCSTQDIALATKIVNERIIENSQIKNIYRKLCDIQSENKILTYSILGGEETKKWLDNIEERGDERVVKSLSNNELQDQLWKELDKYKYHDGEWEGRKYYVEEIYSDEKVVIIRDNETSEEFKVSYTIEDGKVKIDMDSKKLVHRTYEEMSEKKEFCATDSVVFAKKDYGTGKSITVDKSKEAMSETSWGSVNKTELRKKVLDAKNYKSLVKDVYLIVEDGWEDEPSSKLKYPVMEMKENKAVYNRYGLASALSYAKANNETEVVNKVKSLYKKLDIENEEDKGGEKKMAKELEDKKVVDNKLDKDNKDIEKIRDDAEAQEDDEKEKVSKNSNTCEGLGFSDEKIKENKIEKDDEGEEDLEDDVDADKDYWKKKANALEVKNAEMEEELKKYRRADEEAKMSAKIDEFSACMSDEEAEELRNSIKEMSMKELEEKINSKVADFALKMKEKKENEFKYSVNPYFYYEERTFSDGEKVSIDSILKNSKVKVAKK